MYLFIIFKLNLKKALIKKHNIFIYFLLNINVMNNKAFQILYASRAYDVHHEGIKKKHIYSKMYDELGGGN